MTSRMLLPLEIRATNRLVQTDDDSVNRLVGDKQVGTAAEHPQRRVASVAPLHQLAQGPGVMGPKQQIGPPADAIPRHVPDLSVGGHLDIEIAE